MKTIYGEYDENGYRIFLDGGEIYSAGNCIYDSSTCVSVKSKGYVGIKNIRIYCINTGKDMAKENGYKWGGARKVDLNYD